MSSFILDASALIALVLDEPGGDRVLELGEAGAAISTVNLSEVVAKLSDTGWPETEIHDAVDPLWLDIVPFDADLAYRAGRLRPLTRSTGLSFGDRACLALAAQVGLPVLTADRAWQTLPLDVDVRVIR